MTQNFIIQAKWNNAGIGKRIGEWTGKADSEQLTSGFGGDDLPGNAITYVMPRVLG